MMTREDLDCLLDPATVAIVGASEDIGKFGGRALHNLMENGYGGRIIPINPARDRLRGLTAYASITDAPKGIDVAVLAVPSHYVEGVVADCAAAGVGACIVISSQFAETGPEGAARQDALVEVARAANMRLLGPNCLGLAVPARSLALSPSVVFTDGGGLQSGGIALVSQSGALMTQMYVAALDAHAGFSACVSVGNQADLELVDFMEWFIDDPAARVIACYVEGLKTPERFVGALARARAAGKPVVVAKAGRSAAGALAVGCHTASIAGEHAAFAAACARHGATLFDEAEDMIRAADVLDRCGRASGTRYAVVSGSGGGGALATDKLAATPYDSAVLSAASVAALAADFAEPQRKLPIDLGANLAGFGADRAVAPATTVMNDPGVDCAILVMTPQPFIDGAYDAFVTAGKAAGKPVLVVAQTGFVRAALAGMVEKHGYPILPSLDCAIACLAAFAAVAEPSAPRAHDPIELPSAGRLNEIEVKALLRDAGLRTTADVVARSKRQALAAAEALGYPVVLKAISQTLVHKSDIGGVRLALRDGADLTDAWDRVAAALADHGHAFAGCVVAEMVAGVAELIVGVRRDAAFGPLVVIGFGGTLVEIIEDVVVALAPITPDEALAMMRRLKLWPLLDGARGRPAADVEAAALAASNISRLAVAMGDRLVELDVNPLIVGSKGHGAIAVDGRATLTDIKDNHDAKGDQDAKEN